MPDSAYRASPVEFPALVDLPGEGGGALIAPRWVVTAGHAVHGYALTEVSILGKSRKVARVVFAPGFCTLPASLQKGDSAPAMAFIEGTDDIALVELEAPVTDAVPVPLYRGHAEEGLTVKMLGKGATGTGLSGETPGSAHRGELRHAFNVVTSVQQKWLGCRFDRGVDALPLEGMLGHGDSGSPALIRERGEWQLAGLADHASFAGNIETFVQGKYGQTGYYVRISHYAGWIDAVIAEDEGQKRLSGHTKKP